MISVIEYLFYSYPYFVFILIIVYLLFLRSQIKQKLFIDIFIIICFTIFAGIKVPFTIDLQRYIELYEREGLDLFFIEPFFILIKFLTKTLFNNVIFMFIFYQFFTIAFIIFGLKLFTKDNNLFFSLGLIIYILIPFLFLNSFGVEIRQLLAISISFVAIYYLLQKQYFVYFLLVFLAFLVHYTSIVANFIYLVIFLFIKRNLNRKICILLFIINIISFFILLVAPKLYQSFFKIIIDILLATKYYNYLLFSSEVPILKLLVYNLISIFVLFVLCIRWNFFSKEIKYIIIFFSLSVIMLNMLSEYNQVTRLLYYFFIFQIIFIPYIIFSFKNKFFILSFTLIFYIVQFIYGLFYISPYGDRVFLPYKGFYIYLFDIRVKETK